MMWIILPQVASLSQLPMGRQQPKNEIKNQLSLSTCQNTQTVAVAVTE